jgi:hypothetical protein
MRTFSLLLLLAFGVMSSSAQWPAPSWGEVFLQNEIPEVHISISQESLDLLLLPDSAYSDFEHEAAFTFISSLGTETVGNIGFRLRGNTSRLAAKKSFKVSFNTFTNGGEWHGLEKLNLNGEHNDPSILRSRLNWEMADQAGLTYTRCGHVKLFINDEYYGLYINVEHIDENFITDRFGSDARNFYKCYYGANLDYISNNQEDYKQAPWGTRTYELKNNNTADDYTELVHFIDVLNNTSNNQLPCAIEQVFDVDLYLRTLAFEVLIGHWDGYAWNNNNYYLVQRTQDNKFTFVEYDLDNTLGIDWIGIDWSSRNIYNWAQNNRPLANRLLQNAEYRNRYTYYFHKYMNEILTEEAISARLDQLIDLITPDALLDEYRTFDYGFDNDAFLASPDEGWGGHVSQGIKQYIQERYNSASQQLESFSSPLVLDIPVPSPRIDNNLFVQVSVLNGSEDLNSLIADISWDSGFQEQVILNDSGSNGDLVAGDNIWSTLLPASSDLATFNILAEASGNTFEVSCSERKAWTSIGQASLVINELMSDNTTTISDATGEFADWIECYNNLPTGVQFSDYRLTDNLEIPELFKAPNQVIGGNSFTFTWADNDHNAGANHAAFRLSNGGENLYLLRLQNGAFRVVDHIAFPAVLSDQSYGRIEDGPNAWILFDTPTPNESNHLVYIHESNADLVAVYPNPTLGILTFSKSICYQLMNTSGQLLKSDCNSVMIDISGMEAGIYLLKIEERIVRIVKI